MKITAKSILGFLSIFVVNLAAVLTAEPHEVTYSLPRSSSDPISRLDITERMKAFKVGAVSIAVVRQGELEWAQGYGQISSDPNSLSVDPHTLFQAASISKPLTAFGALLLVQQEKISLDEDINQYLKRWKIPENEYTRDEKVTLRRLLSHSAGINVSGFSGYSQSENIPSLVQILNGEKPANTDPIRVVSIPGANENYSGGGTTIVQLLIEDITGVRFDDWMQANVLTPLGMLESTFKQPLPQNLAFHATSGYHLGSMPVEGKWNLYPEMAAAGLWTTPSDLARLIIYIQNSLKNGHSSPLGLKYVKEMITRQKVNGVEGHSGLGLMLEHHGENLVFWHNGQNEGFISYLSGEAYGGSGIVIMINNDSAQGLMNGLKAIALEQSK